MILRLGEWKQDIMTAIYPVDVLIHATNLHILITVQIRIPRPIEW